MAEAAEGTRFGAFSRDKFIPTFDANAIRKVIGWTPTEEEFDWVRIDKSEVYEYTLNPQTSTRAYIDTANDENMLDSYQKSMEQEIVIDGNNKAYQLLYEYMMAEPVGSDAVVPLMQIMPSVEDPAKADAWLYREGQLVPATLNTVDKKLTFTMNFNGKVERGYGENKDGKFTYTKRTEEGGGSPSPASLESESNLKKSVLSSK